MLHATVKISDCIKVIERSTIHQYTLYTINYGISIKEQSLTHSITVYLKCKFFPSFAF